MAHQARAEVVEAEKGISRRSFLRYGVWVGLFVLTAEILGATVISLLPKKKAGAFGSKIPAGAVGDYSVGSITYFREARFYLSRVENGFLALNRRCTHLGCVVPWQPDEQTEDKLATSGRFNCPCHVTIFNRYGEVISGPAPRPLDLHPISIEGGKLIVDTGTVIVRQSYEPSQVTRV